jgi:hypothetical protein
MGGGECDFSLKEVCCAQSIVNFLIAQKQLVHDLAFELGDFVVILQ